MIKNLAVSLCAASLLLAPQFVTSSFAADELKLEVTESNPVKSNLEKLVGKSVTLKLTSGEEITGKVGNVGPEAVHLSQLSGREFFDALVPFEKIEAVIARSHS